MRVVESFEELARLLPPKQGCALTIGAFDGLHVGHQMLVQRTIEAARAARCKSLVVTFVEHPLSVLAPPYCPKRLLLPERKEQALRTMGVDFMARIHFTQEFSLQPPREFVERVLVGCCRARTVVCGHDFRFGKSGGGDVALLRQLGAACGFDVIDLGAVFVHGTLVKSTMIRDLVFSGEVDKAATLLTRPYELKGHVVSGFGRGRKLGFPTANLELLPEYVVPARGVYLCGACVEGMPGVYGAMLNIGFNPTFGLEHLTVEAHLLGFSGDLTGRALHLFFLRRLRDERKFDGVHALIEQLEKDKQTSLKLLESEEVRAWMSEIARLCKATGGVEAAS